MTDEELVALFDLLRRYSEEELDQWDTWRTETKYGTVFISISRQPQPGATPASYEPFPGPRSALDAEALGYNSSPEARARFDAQCELGASVVGVVKQHAPFGFFADFGWHIPGLMQWGAIPSEWHGTEDFPPVGAKVRAEVIEATESRGQVRLRFIGVVS